MTPNPIGRARQSIREASYAYPQSVMDALADAETLRMAYRPRAVHAVYDPLYRAAVAGNAAAWWVRDGFGDQARDAARIAAREAFRAVPGLRDEEAA